MFALFALFAFLARFEFQVVSGRTPGPEGLQRAGGRPNIRPMRYREKLVVITGVGRKGQVGEYLAGAFAGEGAHVIAVDRDEAELTARVRELTSRGLSVTAESCDLTLESDVDRLAERVAGAGNGRLDALINAAGGFAASGEVAASDPEVWTRMRMINFESAYLTTRALLPYIRAAPGAVIFFGSAAALPGERSAGLVGYSAAKAAVLQLMRTVAQEERPSEVRANAVAPTAIRTAANIESMGENQRFVEREEIADLVLYLCSPAGRAVTGQIIRLG